MKELIPMNEHGIFADMKDTARLDSRFVAETFEKQHKNVLRDIEQIIAPDSGWSEEFNRLNFEPITYIDGKGRKQKAYAMTRDGFTALVMGYTGKKAAQFKEAYIRRFNEMEEIINSVVSARHDFPLLTAHIASLHEKPKPYHFSNECDLINRIVTGMTAKQFRSEHGISKGESIRPHLTKEQIHLLDTLQKVDMGLLIAEPDYQQRRIRLEWYAQNVYKPAK